MSKNKDQGTRAETAVVRFLSPWWPHVERRALKGGGDQGDLAGIVGVCIQVKDWSEPRPNVWFGEVLTQQQNAGADACLLVARKKYKPVAKWDTWMPYGQICPDAATPREGVVSWMRMDLDLAVAWLKHAGY